MSKSTQRIWWRSAMILVLAVSLTAIAGSPSLACVTCGSSTTCVEVLGSGAAACKIEETHVECGFFRKFLGGCRGTRKTCTPVGECKKKADKLRPEIGGGEGNK